MHKTNQFPKSFLVFHMQQNEKKKCYISTSKYMYNKT